MVEVYLWKNLYFDDFLLLVRIVVHGDGRVAGRVQPPAHARGRQDTERGRSEVKDLSIGYLSFIFSMAFEQSRK